MSLRSIIMQLGLLASFVSSVFCQTVPSASGNNTVLKTKARLVLVDVVVTSDKGEPVSGLPKNDFEVLEDGKSQTLSTFEEHRGTPITQIKLPPLPQGVYTNYPLVQSADSVNVLLLDALNTPSRDQYYVRSEMIKYLKTIPPGAKVAIFTLASQLRMLQGVTGNSSELLAAFNSSKSSQSSLLPSEAENGANQRRVDFLQQESQGPPPKNLADAAFDPVQAAKQFVADTQAFQTEQRIGITLQALQQLALYLSGVPGRKNVIWFSGSFPTGIFSDPDLPDPFNIARSFQDEIRKTSDLLSSAQLALYPVAAEGLASDSSFQVTGTEIGQKRPSLAMRDQVKEMQAEETSRDLNHSAMEDLAKDTGGQAYYNTNGLGAILSRVTSNGAHYYSLAYSPSNAAMDGKFRRIQVKLLKGKYNLAYRRGYYADDFANAPASRQKTDADPLMRLLGRNMPNYTQILFKVLLQPVSPQPPANAPHIGSNAGLKGPNTRYGVDFAISVGDLRLDTQADGSRHGAIEVALCAYDREGKPLNLVATRGDVALQPSEYTAVEKGGLQIHKEIDVPNGYAFLRMGIYDLKTGSAGTLGAPLLTAVVSAKK